MFLSLNIVLFFSIPYMQRGILNCLAYIFHLTKKSTYIHIFLAITYIGYNFVLKQYVFGFLSQHFNIVANKGYFLIVFSYFHF